MSKRVESYLTPEGQALYLIYYQTCLLDGMTPEEAAIEALDALLYDPNELPGEIDTTTHETPLDLPF